VTISEARVTKGPSPERAQTKVSVEEMPLDFLICRSDRHLWRFKGDKTVVSRGYLVEFTRRHECERCDAWKEVTRSVPSFEVIRKSGNYPPGYLHDGGRLHSAEVFIEQLTRMGSKIRRSNGA
jgi:hypothetical protein